MAQAGAQPLPAIDVLAARANVSRMTMYSRICAAIRTGRLLRLPGRRGYVLSSPRPAPSTSPDYPESRTHSLSRALIDDIVRGQYPADAPLPPYKVLSHRYGASYGLLRESLESLVEGGTLIRHGRGYRIARPRPAASTARITVLANTTTMAALCEVGTRTTDLWRSLEHETQGVGLPVSFLAVMHDGGLRGADSRRFSSIGEAERALNSLGHIALPIGMSSRALSALMEQVRLSRLPVAVLEESARSLCVDLSREARTVMPVALGFGQLPGYLVGRRLLELGHRDVVFMCLSEGDVAFGERLAGMRAAFDELGMADRVRSVTIPRWKRGIGALHERIRRSEVSGILARARREAAGALVGTSRPETLRRLAAAHTACARVDAYTREAQQLCAMAREHDGATAWVAINDELALMAMRYLRRARVRVPSEVSVVGFDDSVDAFGAGLSSYDFNVTGVVRAMLDHIVARRTPVGLRRTARGMEVPGTLMERQSLTAAGRQRCARASASRSPTRRATRSRN